MKNFLKVGFFAIALGVFAVSCGSGAKTETADSTAAATTTVDSTVSTVKADSATVVPVDTAAAKVDSTKK